jgi:hypothetical protein
MWIKMQNGNLLNLSHCYTIKAYTKDATITANFLQIYIDFVIGRYDNPARADGVLEELYVAMCDPEITTYTMPSK